MLVASEALVGGLPGCFEGCADDRPGVSGLMGLLYCFPLGWLWLVQGWLERHECCGSGWRLMQGSYELDQISCLAWTSK